MVTAKSNPAIFFNTMHHLLFAADSLTNCRCPMTASRFVRAPPAKDNLALSTHSPVTTVTAPCPSLSENQYVPFQVRPVGHILPSMGGGEPCG